MALTAAGSDLKIPQTGELCAPASCVGTCASEPDFDRLIDLARLQELLDEIGSEDLSVIVDLFLEETDAIISRIANAAACKKCRSSSQPPPRCRRRKASLTSAVVRSVSPADTRRRSRRARRRKSSSSSGANSCAVVASRSAGVSVLSMLSAMPCDPIQRSKVAPYHRDSGEQDCPIPTRFLHPMSTFALDLRT